MDLSSSLLTASNAEYSDSLFLFIKRFAPSSSLSFPAAIKPSGVNIDPSSVIILTSGKKLLRSI